jgi:hypothetical protein
MLSLRHSAISEGARAVHAQDLLNRVVSREKVSEAEHEVMIIALVDGQLNTSCA